MTTISASVKQLSLRIAEELASLHRDQQKPGDYADTLVYRGHWQDAIPRAIWFDPLLQAIDVRAWGLIRTQTSPEAAIMLSINRLLQQFLGYSKPTVSRILYVLRLTRWISLCSRLRQASGRFNGTIYAIHDQAISVTDALYLDTGYIGFVKRQADHKNQQIHTLAQFIWRDLQERIDNEQIDFNESTEGGDSTVRPSIAGSQVNYFNPVKKHPVHLFNLGDGTDNNPDSKINQALNRQVKKLNPVPSCSSSLLNKTTTTEKNPVSEKSKLADLLFPNAFNASEQELAWLYLQKIDPELRQPFLDETAAQIEAKQKTSTPIKNPIAYLCWLCNEHRRGNTLLTSVGIRYRDNRIRQENTDRQTEHKKQQLTLMAQASAAKPTRIDPNRWGTSAIKPKSKN